jgi:hypothetical protein
VSLITRKPIQREEELYARQCREIVEKGRQRIVDQAKAVIQTSSWRRTDELTIAEKEYVESARQFLNRRQKEIDDEQEQRIA